MTAAEVLEAVRASRGLAFELEGPCTGGEVGAYFAQSPEGRRVVFKWTEDRHSLAQLSKLVDRVNRLRTDGYPAPRYLPPLLFDAGVLIVQDAVPGAWSDDVDLALVDAVIELNDRQSGGEDGGDDWRQYIERSLTEGVSGYCLHDSLRRYSSRTREFLEWIQGVGAEIGSLPSSDIVHFDFHHRNVLRVGGDISAVVDWEGSMPGDRVFDLVTFCLGFTHANAPKGAESRLWARAEQLASNDRLAPYVAHMVLRRLDWTIRHHPRADVEAVLEAAARYRGYVS